MRARIVLLTALAVAVCAASPLLRAQEVPYPHETRIADCTRCHTAEIYTEDCHERDGYCLVARSVDELCLTCHVKQDCCRVGQGHQQRLYLGKVSHPSDLDIRYVDRDDRPSRLPIHSGRITCRTCHLHSRAEGADYKMLRLVVIERDRVDWSILCQDCHDK